MRFYRLEKENLWTYWGYAILKSFALALGIVVLLEIIMGYKFMIVSSGSMAPTLPVGSLVMVTPCEYDDLELGDIVTMNKGGTHLTHRIVGKKDINNVILANPGEEGYDAEAWEKATWYTKGDYAGAQADSKLDSNEIIGKVYEAHCFTIVGDIVMYVQSNYLLLIVFFVIFSVFIYVMKFLRDKLVEDDIECYENDDEE